MKIIADKNIPFLDNRIPGAELIKLPASAITAETVKDADAIIVRTRTRCDSNLLEGSKVRLVTTATIGTDHIDIPWCAGNGITVRNAPGSNAPGVALYVWGSLLRNGFDPSVSTLGVIGCGNVGSIVASWGEKLGARVLVCDPPRADKGMTDREYLPLHRVLTESDAITLHTPLTREGAYPTFHLINKETIEYLKPGVLFVNAARGEIADTQTLCKAISEGKISKSIIDTWENEPAINSDLLKLADVATPHIAGYSKEGKQRATRMALEAVKEILGTPVDLNGLQGPYREPLILNETLISGAYDPGEMTAALKGNPENFESLRNLYPLHKEIL